MHKYPWLAGYSRGEIVLYAVEKCKIVGLTLPYGPFAAHRRSFLDLQQQLVSRDMLVGGKYPIRLSPGYPYDECIAGGIRGYITVFDPGIPVCIG